MPVLADPVAAIRKALQDPIAAPPLTQAARSARNVAIAICDITRPVPNHLFLRPLIETLLAAGIPAERIRVLVATGLHRPNLGAELDQLIVLDLLGLARREEIRCFRNYMFCQCDAETSTHKDDDEHENEGRLLNFGI
jgi:nickel-dependent lactate racemase